MVVVQVRKVGIVGIGGLGYMCVMFAKAKVAEVYAFSLRANKKEDSLKLGADHYIAIIEDKAWETKISKSLDLLIVCSGR